MTADAEAHTNSESLMRLTGKLVTLRPLVIEDAAITLGWRLSKRARFQQRGAQTEEEQRAWIASKDRTGELNFIIEFKGEPVGMTALHSISQQNRSAMMGRLLIGEQEKVGSAPVFFETELLLCDHVFYQLKMHKLYGEIMEDNIGMIRSRLYLGYKQDGFLRDHFIFNGSYKNSIVVSLLEDEYRTVCRPKLLGFISLFAGSTPD
jgi:RimJ/RimL family protein N-acetyltransferase